MKVGMGGMQLSRKDFWALTMPEFWSMYEFRYSHLEPKFTRDDLEEMMERNPD